MHKPRWNIGDRVTRLPLANDRMWVKPVGKYPTQDPLKHGTVVDQNAGINRDAVVVRFDDGTEGTYLDYGINCEKQ
jgi:hypothetical protein